MLKRIKVRGKLLLLLATPLIAVVLFAYSGVTGRTEAASFQEREARIVELAQSGSKLSLAIQVERLHTIEAERSSLDMTTEGMLSAEHASTNNALDHWLAAVDATRGDLDDADLLGDIAFMVERLPANLTANRVVEGDLASLTSFLDLASRSVDEITAGLAGHAADLDLFRALSEHNRLLAVQSAYADVTSVGAKAIAAGELRIVSATLLEAAESRINANIAAFNAIAGEAEVEALLQLQATGVLPSPASAAAHPVEEVRDFIDDPTNGGFLAWVSQGEDRLLGVNGIIDAILSRAQQTAAGEADEANQEAQSFLILAGSVVLLALIMALLIGRSVSRPLIRLTQNAERLSSEELPALVESMRSAGRTETPVLTPIEVKGRDEIAQLAHALSEIQQVTIDVAEEQGEMLRKGISEIFVNLARRNQSLLDRQIDFIDQLEAREENPDQLENLFRLDHLATRMRRNAESLLVLAGAEPTHRRGSPVEISDVMRVAMGEIEDFSRIQLVSVDAATVAATVAIDLAHLMSELMENATQFSPPDVDVEVVGVRTDDDEYQLTLTDKGIGMSAEQIRMANQTLAEPPIVGLDLSRSLGFTVVSRLAHRLGVTVRLTAGLDGGVTAIIAVPGEMIASPEDTTTDPPDHTHTDATVSADEPVLQEMQPPPSPGADPVPEPNRDPFAPLDPLPTGAPPRPVLPPTQPESSLPPPRPADASPVLPSGDPDGASPVVPPPAPADASPVLPSRDPAEFGAVAADVTSAGLIRRTPRQVDVPEKSRNSPGAPSGRSVQTMMSPAVNRSPDEVRQMLSRYRSGLRKGRAPASGNDNPNHEVEETS